MLNLFWKRKADRGLRHPWSAFAAQHQLDLQVEPAEVKLAGHVESRRVVITGVQSRPESDTARATICIGLLTPLPDGFELVRQSDPVAQGGSTGSQESLSRYRRNWTVTGVDRELAEEFLTPPRLAVMRQIERLCREAAVGIRQGAFYWIERLPLADTDLLADRFSKALLSAQDLDSCRAPSLSQRLLNRPDEAKSQGSDAESSEPGIERGSPNESWTSSE
ncbi:hypothetical protein Mal4_25110 [Maioricimonas rarisocia]|uniref:Uncharacterized protein n=1 Tax=Maioricimonas rarisocia TaxID=2528026 RepID=A0A517Z6T0_9PLAN|nr:hypothetical protein [Maioricimonas rarisocia]QDU38187.1 hypothetical protein Mal4_25110 [Maioricimonas rarisocia]